MRAPPLLVLILPSAIVAGNKLTVHAQHSIFVAAFSLEGTEVHPALANFRTFLGAVIEAMVKCEGAFVAEAACFTAPTKREQDALTQSSFRGA